jgi:hypothetical protein
MVFALHIAPAHGNAGGVGKVEKSRVGQGHSSRKARVVCAVSVPGSVAAPVL